MNVLAGWWLAYFIRKQTLSDNIFNSTAHLVSHEADNRENYETSVNTG